MATEKQKADLTLERGRQAAQIKDPEERKEYIKASADVDKNYDATAQATAIKGNELQRRAILGSYKKGGTVPKTGAYILHKDEKVIPAKKANNMKKEMETAAMGLGQQQKPVRVKKTIHMTIEPTDNKGFTVANQEHHDGMPTGKSKKHAFSNAHDMHQHVMKTYPAPAAPEKETKAEEKKEEKAEKKAAKAPKKAAPAPMEEPEDMENEIPEAGV